MKGSDGEPHLDSVAFARSLRSSPMPAERALWIELQGSKTGYKFVRQMEIGSYFADFCCPSRKVAIELDGESHARRIEEDEARDTWFKEQKFAVLRFRNEEVIDNIEVVVERIRSVCEGRPQWRY